MSPDIDKKQTETRGNKLSIGDYEMEMMRRRCLTFAYVL